MFQLIRIKWGLFWKLFIPLLVVMIVPTVVGSLYNYRTMAGSLESEVSYSNLELLRQTNQAVDHILQMTEYVGNQMVTDQAIASLLETPVSLSSFNDADRLLRVIQTGKGIIAGYPFIANISVYSQKNQSTLSAADETYRNVDAKAFDEMIPQYSREQQSGIWLRPQDRDFLGTKSGAIRYVRFMYGIDGRAIGLLVIHLNDNELLQSMKNLYIRKSGFMAILDEMGQPISNEGTSLSPLQSQLNQINWLSNKEGIARLYGSDKELLLFSYTTSHLTGWKYAAVLPADELKIKKEIIARNIGFVSLLFTVVAVLVSLAMARGIYHPVRLIKSLISGESLDMKKLGKLLLRQDEFGQINTGIRYMFDQISQEQTLRHQVVGAHNQLKAKWERIVPEHVQYFLYRVARGNITDSQEIREQAEEFQIAADAAYVVLLMEWNGPTGNPASYSQQAQVSRSFLTIFKGCPQVDEVYAYKEQEHLLVGIVCSHTGTFDTHLLKEQCEILQKRVAGDRESALTIAIGSTKHGLDQLACSYRIALQTLRLKFVLKRGIVIAAEDMTEQFSADIPDLARIDLLRYFRNHMETGNYGEARQIISEFREFLVANMMYVTGYTYYYRFFISLLDQNVDARMSEEIELKRELNQAFLHFEQRFQHVNDVTEWLTGILQVMEEAQANRNRQLHPLIEQALDIIHLEYTRDLSLFELAERLSVKHTYLSGLFTEEMGKSFKAYLTQIKLEKAKELLRDTDWPIEQIVRAVGYNNHVQFARMFKKYEQLSAMEYRNMIRNTDLS